MTAEQLAEWKSHPTTKEVMQLFSNRRYEAMSKIVNLAKACDARYPHYSVLLCGMMTGYTDLLELNFSDFAFKEVEA